MRIPRGAFRRAGVQSPHHTPRKAPAQLGVPRSGPRAFSVGGRGSTGRKKSGGRSAPARSAPRLFFRARRPAPAEAIAPVRRELDLQALLVPGPAPAAPIVPTGAVGRKDEQSRVNSVGQAKAPRARAQHGRPRGTPANYVGADGCTAGHSTRTGQGRKATEQIRRPHSVRPQHDLQRLPAQPTPSTRHTVRRSAPRMGARPDPPARRPTHDARRNGRRRPPGSIRLPPPTPGPSSAGRASDLRIDRRIAELAQPTLSGIFTSNPPSASLPSIELPQETERVAGEELPKIVDPP